MAEPLVYYDLIFNFTHGEPAYATVQEGRDTIQDVKPCTHCGAAAKTKVTMKPSPTEEVTLTIHADKLNGVASTKRLVQPEPDYPHIDLSGRTIEE